MNKVCSKCRQEKNVTEFYGAKRPHCAECERTAARERMTSPLNRQRNAYRNAKRTADKYGVYDDLTQDDVLYTFAIADGRCQYCGVHNPDNIQLEHICALSRGGHNTLSNITTACDRCNRAKRNDAILSHIETNSFDVELINSLIDRMAYRAGTDRNEIIDILNLQQADYNRQDSERYIKRTFPAG